MLPRQAKNETDQKYIFISYIEMILIFFPHIALKCSKFSE